MDFERACEEYRSKIKEHFQCASAAVVNHVEARHGELTDEETAELARAIVDSGERVVLPAELSPFGDVPSTGGPASLTTLLCPLLLASTGVRVPKLSAPGSVAGGLDTMMVIPGFRSNLAPEEMCDVLRGVGIAHAETSDICPADTFLVAERRKRGLMENPGLAAASLLAKKLAVQGTVAAFDFRVGPAGNIGNDLEQAQTSASQFIRVSKRLNLKIATVLTDNRSFPCSALGRLESLHLLWNMLHNKELAVDLDRRHLETCITIAALAHSLATGSESVTESERYLQQLLASGKVLELTASHLAAQGASLDNLRETIEVRKSQVALPVYANADGRWVPPDIVLAKTFAKAVQAAIQGHASALIAEQQFGMRLLVSPGDQVTRGQPVMEVRVPKPLSGETLDSWTSPNGQILGFVLE